MPVPANLLEISEYKGQGYQPLIDYRGWRVALLRYIDELKPENLHTMQRHDETDEVFVLLEGRCILFLGEGNAKISAIHVQDMEPFKLYNIKKSCWHTHTLSEGTTVLIVENQDTGRHNSPEIDLTIEQREKLILETKTLWQGVVEK